MRQSFRFTVSAYLDGKEILTDRSYEVDFDASYLAGGLAWDLSAEFSAPRNAPVSVARAKGLAEGAASRVVSAFHEALDCAPVSDKAPEKQSD